IFELHPRLKLARLGHESVELSKTVCRIVNERDVAPRTPRNPEHSQKSSLGGRPRHGDTALPPGDRHVVGPEPAREPGLRPPTAEAQFPGVRIRSVLGFRLV